MDKFDKQAIAEGNAISKHIKMRPKIVGRPIKASKKIVNGHIQYRTAVDYRELKRRMNNL